MQIAGTIIGLLIYYALVSGVARICAAKNCSVFVSFVSGLAATIFLCVFVLSISSLYWGRVMLVNDSAAITVAGAIALAVLGGLRCRDMRAKFGGVRET